MRDPWFPVLLVLVALLSVWLGIVGPLPNGFAAWLQGWQTLVGATVAVIAAAIAFLNAQRTLAHASALERHRRERKHAALRATLPLALSRIGEYAQETALKELISQCGRETLPNKAFGAHLYKPVPSETLKSLSEFIEYSDTVNIDVLASTVALIQIHDSRLRAMIRDNNNLSGERIIVKANLEDSIIDATTIYAGAASGFGYARRREDALPNEITWDDVASALNNLGFWQDYYPRLHDIVTRRATHTRGPFAVFSRQNIP